MTTTTITRTSDSASTTPEEILGYSARLDGRSIAEQMIDGTTVITLMEPDLRTGTLRLPYSTEAAAAAALNLHRARDTFVITDSETGLVDMTYVVWGLDVSFEGTHWIVAVQYREIQP